MEIFIFISIFIFGLIFGSFLNCLILRLHDEESLWTRSRCPKCLKQIEWYDNIPLISFILLRRRCRHCQVKISWQYFIVEFISGFLFLAVFYHLFNLETLYLNPLFFSLNLLREWIFIFALMAIFIYDNAWQEVPMLVLWPASFLILLLNVILGFSLLNIFISASFGALFFLIQYFATKKRGVGEGDIWIGLLLGLFFYDLKILVLAIFLAYMIGAALALYLLRSGKKKRQSRIALGPFLVSGALLALFFGERILTWYFSLL